MAEQPLLQVRDLHTSFYTMDGVARAVYPAHTPVDGDTIFVMATGERTEPGDVLVLGVFAADVVAQAIVRAARQATGIPGFPAARDVERR
jgi:L-aminopeptidase/D-esterase-like protein